MRRRVRSDDGAVAIVMALMMVLIIVVAAFALDLTRIYAARQRVQNALDAAATAGAAMLPNVASAATAAALYARLNDPTIVPVVHLYCVIGSTGATMQLNTNQIPYTCDPRPAGSTIVPSTMTTSTIPGTSCNQAICAVPCDTGVSCNTIKVAGSETVPFYFAPIIGVRSGSTGSVVSAACSGACGSVILNPMDVVVVADRTGSMSSNVTNLANAIAGMLKTMTPSQQFVSLATIDRSSATKVSGCPSYTAPSTDPTLGPWIPIPFSNDYTGATTGSTSLLDQGLNPSTCFKVSSGTMGTYLATPLKLAAYYLLNPTSIPNPLLPTSTYASMAAARDMTPRKVIILETDGQPNEQGSSVVPTNAPIDTTEVGNSNSAQACTNFQNIASVAKSQGIMIVTVAFGSATSASTKCGTQIVANVLASVASNAPNGSPSTVPFDSSGKCNTAVANTDGDYFFCTTNGADLAPIFVTAFGQIAAKTRIVALP